MTPKLGVGLSQLWLHLLKVKTTLLVNLPFWQYGFNVLTDCQAATQAGNSRTSLHFGAQRRSRWRWMEI